MAVSSKPVLAYPNKGDTWDAKNKCWLPGEIQADVISERLGWRNGGATLIGGCCRTSPDDIKQLKEALCNK
jgi:homocysteine S-methyltransferase